MKYKIKQMRTTKKTPMILRRIRCLCILLNKIEKEKCKILMFPCNSKKKKEKLTVVSYL